MTDERPSPPPFPPSRTSPPPSSPPRGSRPPPSVRFSTDSPPAASSRQPEMQVRETGLIAWVESIREDMRREMQVFRENVTRDNEIWKANVQRELKEEIRRLVVEKYLADHKPSSASDTSSLSITEEGTPSQQGQSPLSAVPSAESTGIPGPSTIPPEPRPTQPPTGSMRPPPPPPLHLSSPQIQQNLRQHAATPSPFLLPRKPRIGSYYAVIVDTD